MPGGMQRFRGSEPTLQQVRWRAEATPVARLVPGEQVEIEVPDSSTGQLNAGSTVEDLRRIDLSRVDAAVGPFEIEGARAGDTLTVRIEAIDPGGWGWSAVFRDFGLLRGRFDDDLVVWKREGDTMVPGRGFLRPIPIPMRPMIGWIGVAPAEGDLGMIPPQRHGGNLDNRLHGVGSEVHLPVQRAGALLLVGDPHAAQGDGEVCGTGIETSATVRISVDLLRGEFRRGPSALASTSADPGGRWLVTEGVGPDPRAAAAEATEEMILRLGERGLTAPEAYLLLSVAGHLRLSEVVDEPNWVVSMLFSESLADAAARIPWSPAVK